MQKRHTLRRKDIGQSHAVSDKLHAQAEVLHGKGGGVIFNGEKRMKNGDTFGQ